jgi:hypothetical protein
MVDKAVDSALMKSFQKQVRRLLPWQRKKVIRVAESFFQVGISMGIMAGSRVTGEALVAVAGGEIRPTGRSEVLSQEIDDWNACLAEMHS